MIKLHVFDIDGTVLDSMRMWDEIAFIYLDSMGINAPENLAEILDPMPVPEVNRYIAETFNIPGGPEAVRNGLYKLLIEQYSSVLEPFEDAIDELDILKRNGQRMIAFSNTPHMFLDTALKRHGLMEYFETVYCVDDLGVRKDSPVGFARLCSVVGVDPGVVLVHDDSDFALNAAREAGCMIKKYDRYR